jgi:hypothetical protein
MIMMNKYATLKNNPTPSATWSIFDLVGAALVAPAFHAVALVDDYMANQHRITNRACPTQRMQPHRPFLPSPSFGKKRKLFLQQG